MFQAFYLYLFLLGLPFIAYTFFIVSLGKKGNALLHAGLAMMLGGAYSNTYDRLRRKYVVDYFSFAVPIRKIRNIIFNFSDLCIIIGAMMSVSANIENK